MTLRTKSCSVGCETLRIRFRIAWKDASARVSALPSAKMPEATHRALVLDHE